MTVDIYNGSTPAPKQWTKFISNPKNKENLAEFLCVFLSESLPTRLDASQKVVLAGGFKDGMKTVSVSQNSTVFVPDLSSDHEEADTRLLLQAKNAAITHPRLVIQSPDTDVVILSVAHFEDLQCQELWFKTGVKDKQRYIPIHSIHSGCGSTSAFSGIGKKKAWKVLTNQKHIQYNPSRLGENPVLDDDA